MTNLADIDGIYIIIQGVLGENGDILWDDSVGLHKELNIKT